VFEGRHSTVGRARLLCQNYDGCDKLTASYFVTRGGGDRRKSISRAQKQV